MTSIKKITEKLKAPFPANEIKWRAQRITEKFRKDKEKEPVKYQAFMLAYIDARAVMDRLDEAVGVENWQTTFTETDKGRVLCSLSIKFGDTWVTKTDGAGDTGAESEKGAISDALKRAAVNFGINRVMYSFGDTRVELSKDDIRINPQGKPTYKYGAAKLSEKCRLPSGYLDLLKESQKAEKQPKPKKEVKKQTALEIVKDIVKIEKQQKEEENKIVLKGYTKITNDYLRELYTIVYKLNEEVEKIHGKKTRANNTALTKIIEEIKKETKDDDHRRERRINAYLIKSKENAEKQLAGEVNG
jgi:hypothetical protein